MDFTPLGWVPIDSGSVASGASNFSIAVPAGYAKFKVSLFGSLNGVDRIGLRLNGDTGIDHWWGGQIFDSANPPVGFGFQGNSTTFHLGEWSTVAAQADVTVHLDNPVAGTPSYDATVFRLSNSTAANKRSMSAGRVFTAGSVPTVTSLQIMRATNVNATQFNATNWTLEGYRP